MKPMTDRVSRRYGMLSDPKFFVIPIPLRRALGACGLAGLVLGALFVVLVAYPVLVLWSLAQLVRDLGGIVWREGRGLKRD